MPPALVGRVAGALLEQPRDCVAAPFHVAGGAGDPVVRRDRELVAVRGVEQVLPEAQRASAWDPSRGARWARRPPSRRGRSPTRSRSSTATSPVMRSSTYAFVSSGDITMPSGIAPGSGRTRPTSSRELASTTSTSSLLASTTSAIASVAGEREGVRSRTTSAMEPSMPGSPGHRWRTSVPGLVPSTVNAGNAVDSKSEIRLGVSVPEQRVGDPQLAGAGTRAPRRTARAPRRGRAARSPRGATSAIACGADQLSSSPESISDCTRAEKVGYEQRLAVARPGERPGLGPQRRRGRRDRELAASSSTTLSSCGTGDVDVLAVARNHYADGLAADARRWPRPARTRHRGRKACSSAVR